MHIINDRLMTCITSSTNPFQKGYTLKLSTLQLTIIQTIQNDKYHAKNPDIAIEISTTLFQPE